MRTLTILAIALATAAAAPAANAVICYTLLDRNDTMLYRGSSAPVDMSDQGAAQREALRRQHEYLMIADAENCQAVAASSGAAGYRPATVDEIVSEMRGYLSYGGVSSAPGQTGGGGGGGGEVAAPASGGAASGSRGRY